MALYLDNDNRVTLANSGAGVEDADETLLTGATVQLTVYRDDRSTEMTGISWPQTMTEVGVTAVYRYTLDTASLTNVTGGEQVWLKATLSLSGKTATWWKRETLSMRT